MELKEITSEILSKMTTEELKKLDKQLVAKLKLVGNEMKKRFQR